MCDFHSLKNTDAVPLQMRELVAPASRPGTPPTKKRRKELHRGLHWFDLLRCIRLTQRNAHHHSRPILTGTDLQFAAKRTQPFPHCANSESRRSRLHRSEEHTSELQSHVNLVC